MKNLIIAGLVACAAATTSLLSGCDTNKEKVQAEAIALFKADKWGEASKLAKTTPITNPELQNFMGRACEKKGRDAYAVEYYEKSAQQGFAEGQYNLGYFALKGYRALDGRTVKADIPKGISLYEKAAAQNHVTALLELGRFYDQGENVEKDHKKAFEFFKRAADLGSDMGVRNLGVLYANGRGVEKDQAKAVEYFRKSAEKGLLLAQRNLADCYQFGKGVKKDVRQAIAWYVKAYENAQKEWESNNKANKEASTNDMDIISYTLAGIYYEGDGIPKDMGKAVEWWKKSATLGNGNSAWNIYVTYINGYGIEKNETEAIKWLKIAADTNYQNAKKIYYALSKRHDTAKSLEEFNEVCDGFPLDMEDAKLEYINLNKALWEDISLTLDNCLDVEKTMRILSPAAQEKVLAAIQKHGKETWTAFISKHKKPTTLQIQNFLSQYAKKYIVIPSTEIRIVSEKFTVADPTKPGFGVGIYVWPISNLSNPMRLSERLSAAQLLEKLNGPKVSEAKLSQGDVKAISGFVSLSKGIYFSVGGQFHDIQTTQSDSSADQQAKLQAAMKRATEESKTQEELMQRLNKIKDAYLKGEKLED